MKLSARFSLVLCAVAMVSTVLALIPQERALPADLVGAARARLLKSAAASRRLLDTHLDTVRERYRSVSLTPELRANLETNHAPTLRYFTERLAEEQGASLAAFLDQTGGVRAQAGDGELLDRVVAEVGDELGERGRAFLVVHGMSPVAIVAIPLRTGSARVGTLLAAEPITPDILALWSELCAGDLEFAPPADETPGRLSELVRDFGDLGLRVTVSLEAERRALANARRKLLSGGAVALALAFGMSLVLARGLVRPIREIQDATEPIGRGALDVRLAIDRRDEIGDVARAFNLMLDRLQGTLAALRTSQDRLANAQRLARLGSWSIDVDARALTLSDESLRIYGLPADATPSIEALIARVNPGDRSRLRRALEQCLQKGTPFRLDHRTVELEGRERFLHTQGQCVESDDRPLRVEGTVQDITDRKLIEEQVRYLANHDTLTGLANRRLFRQHLGLAIDEARRSGSTLGLLFIDLDDFKLVNDTFGHSVGDRLLREVAERLVECALQHGGRHVEDGVAPVAARIGGDEFTLMLARIEGPEECGRVARSFLDRLSEPFHVDGHELVTGASIGIATWPSDGDDVETLLRNGDTAMYHAKDQGRGVYEFYSAPMNALVFKRLVLENKLRRAIEEEQLELHFQPKVSVREQRVVGLEALARWKDPELGNVSPAEFIPLAEETGLIGAIGDWVLRSATRQIRAWQDTELSDLSVSVNLSGRELEGSLVERVAGILEEEQVDASRLDLEITETVLMRRDGSVIRSLEKLRELGVQISLDDFGTGYSSLSYLRKLPIDTLKIDRSFVCSIESEADDASLLEAIISMARVLRLRVLVEGVETLGQLARLEEMGCDEIQGNLFSPAVRAEDLVRVRNEIDTARTRKPRRKR